MLRKKHSVLEVDWEMLCCISFPNVAKTYSVHYYFKVASDDPWLILFSQVVHKLTDHRMSFFSEQLLIWWGHLELGSTQSEKDWTQWFLRCLPFEHTLKDTHHSFMRLVAHKWPVRLCPFLSSLTWYFLLSFLLKVIVETLLPFGISYPSVLGHWTLNPRSRHRRRGVESICDYFPSPPRPLVLGTKSPFPGLLLPPTRASPLPSPFYFICRRLLDTLPRPRALFFSVGKCFLFLNNWFTNKLLESCPSTPPLMGLAEVIP